MSRKRHEGPRLAVHPPVVYLLALLAGVGLGFLWPISPLPGWWGVAAGLLVIALGIAIMPSVLLRFRRAGTAFDAHQSASALITDGPYRFSRNPAYVALTLWYLGIGLLLNNGWILLLTVVPVLIMDRWAIPREECHLEERFGQEYIQYKVRVHRWLTVRQRRLLVLFAILVVVVAWAYVPRPWSPSVVLETEHYTIRSSATEQQTREIGQVAEIVHAGYLRLMSELQRPVAPHRKLGIKLFRDRQEFRRCNRMHGWAEAFYQPPYCYQYYSADEVHPYHWMMHEATHQLNDAAARLRLPQWLEEGLACYVSTSRIVGDSLHLGDIDTNTYPVWWLDSLDLSGALDADKKRGTIIPLRAIFSGRGGPSVNRHFNLYYLHWWSLTHFLMHYENGRYQAALGRLIADGGDLPAFEKYIGPIETIESQWYVYLADLQKQTSRATPPVRLKPAKLLLTFDSGRPAAVQAGGEVT
jgi:protein-S-isoprenylcysteine O-methyltransferase Ste14